MGYVIVRNIRTNENTDEIDILAVEIGVSACRKTVRCACPDALLGIFTGAEFERALDQEEDQQCRDGKLTDGHQ